MNESFTKSRYYRLLFAFFYVFVSPVEQCSLENFGSPLRAIFVDFKTLKKTNKTFDDAR
jgi:hypothetical protein